MNSDEALQWGPWISLAIRTAALLFWTHNFWHELAELRTNPSGDAYRTALMAVVVEIGVVAIFLGGVGGVWPSFLLVARAVGVMSAAALLLGGIFIFVNRRKGELR